MLRRSVQLPRPHGGDILLYQTDIVPIRDDQRQHLELTRNVAERFNTRYGETFTVPRGVFPQEGAREEPPELERLMSTSAGNPQGVVRMVDEPEVIRKKFEQPSRTPSARSATILRAKAGISNLIEILSVVTGEPLDGIEFEYDGADRAVQGGRRRSGRDATRAHPGALPRAARRRGRTPRAARKGCRAGARGVEADARGDVRAHGLRQSALAVAR